MSQRCLGPFSLLSCGYGRLLGAGQIASKARTGGFSFVLYFALSESDYMKAVAIFRHVDAIKAYRRRPDVAALIFHLSNRGKWSASSFG